MESAFYKLEIFVPQTAFAAVQQALAEVDAGHIGRYAQCLSVTPVTSWWLPLDGAHPYLGEPNRLSCEPELKVEVCCRAAALARTLAAVKAVHPYEEPVINVLPLAGTGLPD